MLLATLYLILVNFYMSSSIKEVARSGTYYYLVCSVFGEYWVDRASFICFANRISDYCNQLLQTVALKMASKDPVGHIYGLC